MTLSAVADITGNAITVLWTGTGESRVRLLSRRGAYPAPGEDGWLGVVVADSGDPGTPRAPIERTPDGFRVRHDGVAAETLHYYQLLTADAGADPPAWVAAPADRASAMATGPYLFAERLHRMLPGVYHRFDTATPPDDLVAQVPEHLRDAGQLRRFLELTGGELDRLYSIVRSLSGLTDVAQVDGRLLPLLAQWIGWRLDHGLGFDVQRRQIADAPAVFRAVQTVPALEAAARRVTGWGCAAKELMDNVAVTNRPELLDLWQVPLGGGTPTLLSRDGGGEGHPAIVALPDRTVRMVYATTSGRGELWETVRSPDGIWSSSAPLVTGQGSFRDPAVAALGAEVLLFWSARRPGSGWQIEFRRLRRGRWSPIRVVDGPGTVQRRDPAALVEGEGADARLWLFWRENDTDTGPWRLRYKRRPFADWAPSEDGIRDFPRAGNEDVRVDSPVSAALHQGQLWLWWARRVAVDGGTRWRCAFRVKDAPHEGADAAGWGDVVELGGAGDRHDREPFGFVAGDELTVLFGSTRDGGWSVWRAPVDPATRTWGQPVAVTTGAFTERSPAVVDPGTPAAAVVHRSGHSIVHTGGRHGGTTLDRRPSGSTTVRTTDTARLALRDSVDDLLAYTWDTSTRPARIVREEVAGPVAADVVALYLDPGDADPDTVDAAVDRLTAVLPEFLPITIRAALVVRRPPT